MATDKHKSKTTQAALAGQMATGAVKHFPAGAQVLVAGVSLTPAQIQTKLTGFAQLRADVVTARSALEAKLAVEDGETTDENAFLDALEKVVRGSFGSQPDVLADFGLKPEKQPTLTVEQKAAAAAKRASTRAARGTKGSKAKQAIKGDVTGVVVVPLTATQPAATAAAGSNATGAGAPAQGATTAATVTKGS